LGQIQFNAASNSLTDAEISRETPASLSRAVAEVKAAEGNDIPGHIISSNKRVPFSRTRGNAERLSERSAVPNEGQKVGHSFRHDENSRKVGINSVLLRE